MQKRNILDALFRQEEEEDNFIDERQDGACGLKTCDQTVTGRNLAYARALQIIQNEDYLNAIDFEAVGIRRSFRTPPNSPRIKRRRGRRQL